MDATLIQEYETYERNHWWFKVRFEILRAAIDRYVPGAQARTGRWLDVGCGNGSILCAYPGFAEKMGVELDAGCVQRARDNGLNVHQSTTTWDFAAIGSFDCISLFDVLEHVEHEGPALDAVHSALKDNGTLLLTVPALMSLWSDHDVLAHHFRRYGKNELLARFPEGRWQILKISYFSSVLFPLIWCVRKANRLRKRFGGTPHHDLKLGPPLIDATLRTLFGLEKPLLNHISLPIGSSLLLVARKITRR
jgi:2-polyprenyl-3-methyl-5-hydroxy-6-metoxy-1,4-benzoquinol methylase